MGVKYKFSDYLYSNIREAFVLFFIVAVACNNQKIHIKEQTIKELSTFNFSLPSPDIALFLFVKSSDGHLVSLNIIALHEIYTIAYSQSNISFESFLSSALNETMSIDNKFLIKKGGIEFRIDDKVKHDRNSLTLSNFEDKYCNKRNYGQFAIKSKFKTTQNLYSILYYFFINDFKVLSSDYSGEYIVIPPLVQGSVRRLGLPQLNLIAFTGVILVTSIDGPIITSRHTTNVPIFKRIISIQLNCMGTKFI